VAKKPVRVSSECASFLIKMAEDSKLRARFLADRSAVVRREGLNERDRNMAIKLGGKLSLSVSAKWSDPEGQNQQMLVYKKNV
jgi:hypothetical protein